MAAFGREAGPAASPGKASASNQTMRFGMNQSRPPSPPLSPPFPHSSSPPSPWVPEAVERGRSPPFTYDNSGPAANSYQSSGVPRRPGAPIGVRSPSLPYENNFLAGKPFNHSVGAPRVIESPYKWVNGQRPFFKVNGQSNSGPSEVKSFVASRNAATNLTAKITRFQDLQAANFPLSHSMDEEIVRGSNQNSLQSRSTMVNHNGNQSVPSRTRSHPLASQNNYFSQLVHRSSDEGQLLTLPSAWHNQSELPGHNPHFHAREDRMLVPYSDLYNSGGSFRNELDVHAPKQTKSPPVSPVNELFHENTGVVQQESMRPSISPPRLGTGSPSVFSSSDALNPWRPLQSRDDSAVIAASAMSSSFATAKRSRSPPVSAVGETFSGNFYPIQDGTERESQAKAKRLARFKEELSDDLEDGPNTSNQNLSMSKYEQSKVERQKSSGDFMMESVGEFTRGSASSDFEGSEAPSIITGLCPDMCPESERAERERKGDLDQYERLDGDRNQTNNFLAVKKYNRTAEREARLIRPMPVLQKTITYLLNLLDQPYDDKFLGIYNFLWDRMRAIRMDLRMQHIFNQDSITMLEQMIRLHIIAMHELCEYTKGEGFSEGFDAHLNIEQMNKASVELFQMYDDHRKKGINISTEKEFRGYYALLKLDKHPGYKVEPAELSLDLAKMTPEIRQTPEVLFARSVARACRTGNFITFFRLARKASYLQACLMHAHFAKLRSQALASLHSGLLINQGLPVTCVANWLAIEEEDVESLLEYHGFSIKDFEEPYMVKEGQFLYDDKDYPTRCSKLVYLKRSRRIVEDVSPTIEVAPVIVETREIQLPKIYKYDNKTDLSSPGIKKISFPISEEEMPDVQVASSPKVGLPMQPQMKKPLVGQWATNDHWRAGENVSTSDFSVAQSSSGLQPAKLGVLEKLNKDAVSKISPKRKILSEIVMAKTAFHGISPGVKQTEVLSSPIATKVALQVVSPKSTNGSNVENPVCEAEIVNDLEDEEPTQDFEDENEVVKDDEVALAKIKLIIRLWRRRCSKLRMLREERHIAAEVALSSLPLGPLVRQTKDRKNSTAAYEIDIDHVMRERYMKHKKSWSQVNISEVVGKILHRRNPHAKCLFWKIILCPQVDVQSGDALERGQNKQKAASVWLKSKVMPSKPEDADNKELLVSSPALSIWEKWVPDLSVEDRTCCFSVVKDISFGNMNETVAGAGGLLFITSESIPWNLQRIRLHNILMSIPYGASLPLLVLSDLHGGAVSDASAIIIGELGLNDIDSSRVSSFWVCFLGGDEQVQEVDEFLSDKQLKGGLEWLASESPLQPDLLYMKTRELVLFHLNPALDALENMKDCNLSPDHCISAFNEAVDLSLSEITAAAEANYASWPCPEINLLEDLHPEYMIVMRELPGIGWSSAEKIEPLLQAVRGCKLPSFADTGCEWDEGINKDVGIKDLILQLEGLLIKYLTESSSMMAFPFAAKEAHVMIQRSSRLQLCDLSYHVVPNWILVFRRIFNWRLMNLCSGPYSSAYVRRTDHLETSGVLDEHGVEESISSAHLRYPSLDETIHVGCSPPLGRDWLQPEAFRTSPMATSNGYVQVAANISEFQENEKTCVQSDNFLPNGGCIAREPSTASSGIIVGGRSMKEADRLSKLLEKCNIIQNYIDEKLSIYF